MNILKGAVIFAIGVGTGFGIGTIMWKEKYHRQAEADIAEMRTHYEEKVKADKEKKRRKKDKKKAEEIIKENQYVSYDKMSEEEVRNKVNTIQENVVLTAHPSDDIPEYPYVIDEPAFSEDELMFEKIQADYYLDDGTLVDENEEMLNIDDCIGFENLERFLNTEKQGIMYIRNPRLATDYEITKVGGKYSDILGISEEDDDD